LCERRKALSPHTPEKSHRKWRGEGERRATDEPQEVAKRMAVRKNKHPEKSHGRWRGEVNKIILRHFRGLKVVVRHVVRDG
jgi:hypothetical protein